VATFVDGTKDKRVLSNERLPAIELFPKGVGKAPILSIMGAKRLRVPAIPSVGLALHDGSNLRLITFIVGLSYGYPLFYRGIIEGP
jgi:hypothetical protein